MTTIPNIGQSNMTSVLGSTGGSFDDNPFLQLLTEQLKHQTPLEPVDNASFMQQMSSYSSMQEQKDLNKHILQLLDYQGLLARMQGLSESSALLGKVVTYDAERGTNITGKVESVFVDDEGNVMLRLDNQDEINMRTVHGVANA